MADGVLAEPGALSKSLPWRLNVCSILQTSTSAAALRGAFKQALSLSLAGLLTFIPYLRSRTPQSAWAAIAVSFILTNVSLGLGASVAIAEVRLLGTVLGSMFGLFALVILSSITGNAFLMSLSLLLGLWVSFCSLFRAHPTKGFAAVVAAYTAAIIEHSAGTVQGASSGDDLATERIKMEFVGIFVFVLVELCVWPVSARNTIRKEQGAILERLGEDIAAALSPFQEAAPPCDVPRERAVISLKSEPCSETLERRTDWNEEGHCGLHEDRPLSGTAGSIAVDRSVELLTSATVEPSLWRTSFPHQALERVLQMERRCIELTSFLHGAAAMVDMRALPPVAPQTMVAFGKCCFEATSMSSKEWITQHPGGSGNSGSGRGCMNWTRIELEAIEDEEAGQLNAFSTATKLASPLMEVGPYTENSLVQQRDLLALLLFEEGAPTMAQGDIVGWMASSLLCQELGGAMSNLGSALRDVRAHETAAFIS
jgi:hypothetical protein